MNTKTAAAFRSRSNSNGKASKSKPYDSVPSDGLDRVKFLCDEAGTRTDAVVPIEVYHRILEDLEDLEDIRYIDAVKRKNNWVSLADVKAELEL